MSSGATAPKQQLKLKLRQSPGSDPNTPGARSSGTPGVIVDSEALHRQQRHVLDSMTSNRASRPVSAGKAGTPTASTNPFTGPRVSSTTSSQFPNAQTRTAGSPPAINGVKQDVQSPALSAIRPASTRSDSQGFGLSAPVQTSLPIMAPPHTTSQPTSGSPHPNGVTPQTGYNPPYQPPSYYVPPVVPRVDSFRKVPLKSELSLTHDVESVID